MAPTQWSLKKLASAVIGRKQKSFVAIRWTYLCNALKNLVLYKFEYFITFLRDTNLLLLCPLILNYNYILIVISHKIYFPYFYLTKFWCINKDK